MRGSITVVDGNDRPRHRPDSPSARRAPLRSSRHVCRGRTRTVRRRTRPCSTLWIPDISRGSGQLRVPSGTITQTLRPSSDTAASWSRTKVRICPSVRTTCGPPICTTVAVRAALVVSTMAHPAFADWVTDLRRLPPGYWPASLYDLWLHHDRCRCCTRIASAVRPIRLSRSAGHVRAAAPVRIVHLGLGNFFRAPDAGTPSMHGTRRSGALRPSPERAAMTSSTTSIRRMACYTLVSRASDDDRFEVISSPSRAHVATGP